MYDRNICMVQFSSLSLAKAASIVRIKMKYIIAILSYFLTLFVFHRLISDPFLLALVAIIVGGSAGIVFERANTLQEKE